MPRVQVKTVQGPSRWKTIKGLIAFNTSAVGKGNYKPLTITLRQGKEIVGGLAGYTWMGWLFSELLWIADKYRGKGHGASLMKKAEDEARKRGGCNGCVSSFTFQASGSYKRLGYRQVEEISRRQ